MAKKVRILVATTIDGIAYQPNEVVEFSDVQAKELAKADVADDATAAVAYCVNELKAKVKEHPGARVKASAAKGQEANNAPAPVAGASAPQAPDAGNATPPDDQGA